MSQQESMMDNAKMMAKKGKKKMSKKMSKKMPSFDKVAKSVKKTMGYGK